MNPLPMTAVDLVKELDEAYPARHPSIDATDRRVWWDAGQRALVDHLLLRLAKLEANPKLLSKER